MDANPYLAPETAGAAPLPASVQAPAFAVSTTKFIVMSLATGGLYEFYWFYKQWQVIRRRTGHSISPFWRAFFGIIWCYSCLSELHEAARREGVARSLSVGSLTAGWVILNLLSRLPDPWWLVSLGAFVFLVPVQQETNALIEKVAPEADRNSRFTAANIAWLALMSIFWALVLIATLLPEPAAA